MIWEIRVCAYFIYAILYYLKFITFLIKWQYIKVQYITKVLTRYTVPEIVIWNRIINFWYYWRGGKDIQIFKIWKLSTVWFSRFPYFKLLICSEFALLFIGKLKIAQLNALSRLRFSMFSLLLNGKFTAIHCRKLLKSREISRTKHWLI